MKDMDANYIVPKLLKMCDYWYGGEPFAKYSERQNKYIFGSIKGGVVYKNIVTKAVAIYIVIGCDKLIKNKKRDINFHNCT